MLCAADFKVCCIQPIVLFPLTCSPGEIINWVALDYEQETHHQLVVLVTDHGAPRLNATVMAYISVTDLNDNHPCFSQFSAGAEFRIKVCSYCFRPFLFLALKGTSVPYVNLVNVE